MMSADPRASYLSHKAAIDSILQDVMIQGNYILGPRVTAFEQRFANYLNVQHCIGVASGTDALHLALRALGVRQGDGVITTSHTAVATVAAIDWCGATPILVDIDPTTYTLDPQKVQDTLMNVPRGYVKAIIAVHLYGHAADMKSLVRLSERYGCAVIEDCAQAHGATLGLLKAGAIGNCGTFSFYPTKNLGAFGDAGAITTNDSLIAARLRSLHQYGWRQRYISDEPGYNSRLDELQAAILEYKLGFLDTWNSRRRDIATRYAQGLADLPLKLPVELHGHGHVYHQYAIRLSNRAGLRTYLESQGILTSVLYPKAVHQQPGYRHRVAIGVGGLSTTERIVDELLCLPIYPELNDIDVNKVIEQIRRHFGVS